MSIQSLPGVDWFQLLMEMRQRGYTQAAIGAAVGSSRSAVEQWMNQGIEPSHELGERLCALWRVATGRPREEIPRKVQHILSAADFK